MKEVKIEKYNKYLSKFMISYSSGEKFEYTIPLMLLEKDESI